MYTVFGSPPTGADLGKTKTWIAVIKHRSSLQDGQPVQTTMVMEVTPPGKALLGCGVPRRGQSKGFSSAQVTAGA